MTPSTAQIHPVGDLSIYNPAIEDHSDKYCIIGAGSAGLAAAKNLKQFGIPFDCYEREDDVGGNWYFGKPYSSIYNSVHTITSKHFTEYLDFPLPDHYPTYINHQQAFEYLRSYARAFGLYDHIKFLSPVEKVEPSSNGETWDVTVGGVVRRYKGIVICNGHLWDPRIPQYPGTFSGKVLHSSEYKFPDALKGKRVLVVGAGNSGCDIAVEAAHHATDTYHSTRRGYHYWPKFLFGMPADAWAELPLKFRVPLFMRRLFGALMIRWFSNGNPRHYGLPEPDHKMFEDHFIINSQLTYHLAHGDLEAVPNIESFDGNRVRFTDGSEREVDVIIYATGFNLKFPFIHDALLDFKDGAPDLFLNVFHRKLNNLFVIGMFQTSTGNWPLMDYQSRLLARFIVAQEEAVSRFAWFTRFKTHSRPRIDGGIRFSRTARHLLECEHFTYRLLLQKMIRKFGIPQPPLKVGVGAAGIPRLPRALPRPQALPQANPLHTATVLAAPEGVIAHVSRDHVS